MNWTPSMSVGMTRMVVLAIVLAVSAVGAVPAAGDAAKDARDAQQLVERARVTVENFVADRTVEPSVRNLIKSAKGVYIAPEVLRGAFIVGASGGSGVLLVRGDSGLNC
jgi:SH3 domain-containing YSC84-like protein 1